MATDAFYPSIEVVYILDDGSRVPLATENVEFYNITQAVTIDTLTTNATGVLEYGGFDSGIDPADPGDVVELRHGTYTLTRQFKLQPTQDLAFTSGENNVSTYVVQDDSTGSVAPEKVAIYVRDEAFPFQKPRKIGEAPVDGSTVKIPYQTAIAQSLKVFANPVSKDAQPEFADPSVKVNQSLSVTAVGGGMTALADFYTDAASETSLQTMYGYTIPAGTLANNGDKIFFEFAGRFASNVNDKELYLDLNGTAINYSELLTSNGTKWEFEGWMIRVSNTALRYESSFLTTGEPVIFYEGEITALDLGANDYTLALQAVTEAAADATAKLGTVWFIAAAPVAEGEFLEFLSDGVEFLGDTLTFTP